MIDYFSIALTHALIALAAFRLLGREELDVERSSGRSRWRPRSKRPPADSEGRTGDA